MNNEIDIAFKNASPEDQEKFLNALRIVIDNLLLDHIDKELINKLLEVKNE